jgi:hypothetical protein
MKTFTRTLAAVGCVAAAGLAQGRGSFATPESGLDKPFKVAADGKPIDVEVGHAAPLMYDWDKDGLPDLLVGQFGKGKLRVYKNVGEKNKPAFKDFVFAQAGGADATVPAG